MEMGFWERKYLARSRIWRMVRRDDRQGFCRGNFEIFLGD